MERCDEEELAGLLRCEKNAPVHEVMRAAADAWPSLMQSLERGLPHDGPPPQLLLDVLSEWRRTRVCVSGPALQEDRRCAHFLVEAALRLILADWVHRKGADDATSRADSLQGVTPLAVAERAALAVPAAATSPDGALQQVVAVTAQWRLPCSEGRELAHLGAAAYALLIRPDAGSDEVVRGEMPLLRAAERCSTLCAARAMLRRLESVASFPEAPERNKAAVLHWAITRAATPHSEAAAKGHSDALAQDRLDPARLPPEDAREASSAIATRTPVATLLTMQSADAATAAADGARAGVRSFATAVGRDKTLLLFSMFDHAARQAHGSAWAAAYTITDARPEAALRRLRTYRQDRMVSPPPLLLLLEDRVIAITRCGGALMTESHEDGASALAAWAVAADAHRAVGPRHAGLLRALLAGAPADGGGGAVMLPLRVL